MSNTYLLKLTPLESFFFGGNKTFNSGDEAAYFVKSEYFPQQTSILGLLRYYLLKRDNKLNQNDKGLIGESSFDISNEKAQSFGKIESISPVFITDNDGVRYMPNPKNLVDKSLSSYYYPQEVAGSALFNSLLRQNAYCLKKIVEDKQDSPAKEYSYNSKDGYANLLLRNDGEDFLHFDYEKNKPENEKNGIFASIEKTGIYKDRTGDTKDKAFYVQTRLKLLSGYSYGCYITLTDNYEPLDDVLPFGAEQAQFSLSFSKKTSEKDQFERDFAGYIKKQSAEKVLDKIILLSDAIATSDIYQHTDFAITETRDFQFIVTPAATTEYSSLSRNGRTNTSRYISAKFNLLKRGSILYTQSENTEKVTKQLAIANYRNVGYNSFKIIPKKNEQ